MTAEEILQEIRMLGGRVEARGDLLHVEVPPGLLTPKLREAIRNQKPELLSLLRSNSGSEYTK
jgi:TubC N-terminal docking domain